METVDIAKTMTIGKSDVSHAFTKTTFANTISVRGMNFEQALNSGRMLVKSMATGEVKAIDVPENTISVDCNISNLTARDGRIRPKQNYTRVDPERVNIYAHKGPDENKGGGIAL